MVLEPWITPSLFYQFLGGDETNTAMDQWSFCQVLGPEEANRQLKNHWSKWVTEDIINELAASGAVNSLRLPIGDFMYKPYGPYVGCVDGALEYVDQLLDWAYAAGLTVLLDIHAHRGSQNGFDNSGQSMGFEWTSALNTEPAGLVTFQHWPIRDAGWMGKFDPHNMNYTEINYDNIKHSLEVIETIVDMYSGHPAVLGLEPVNEPWQFTPMEELKQFYWDAYLIVKKNAPYWKYIMHDAFQFDPAVWGGFMDGCPDRALDTHIYQAWQEPNSRLAFYTDACSQQSRIAEMEKQFGPVVVGEWSLATDNCAMYLNGFQDNLPGFPRLPCKYTKCRDSYLGPEHPGNPLDPSKGIQGPYGTGQSTPIFGYCPGGRDWQKESSGNPATGKDWIRAPPESPPHLDDTDNVISHLANKKILAFSGAGHGFYFWNFRTDLYEPHWSYMEALERGWIPRGNLNTEQINNACRKEETGEFKCVLKHGQLDATVRGAVKYVLNAEGVDDADAGYIDNLSGPDLSHEAEKVLSDFWKDHFTEGATCDFGGIMTLVEVNRTITDDDSVDDDEYYTYTSYYGPSIWVMVLVVILVGLLGGLLGFIIAMRTNKRFNRRVRESRFFQSDDAPHFLKTRVVRNSLALPSLGEDYTEIEPIKE